MGERGNATVLVVDDEEPVREAYKMYLESADYDVLSAATGGEALIELGPEIDVVLLDRRMPGMSGDEVLDHIEEWESHCRVAMVTAVDPGDDIADMGFDDYLNKPVSKDELLDTIEQLLLFDRYEDLLTEYHSVVRKYALLRSNTNGVSGNDQLASLEQRRDDLRSKIHDVIDQFTDDAMADVFREAHA
jgi:CheY-like chemotaxis protein